VLVLRKHDEQIKAASVMEGASVLARFKDRSDWVGLSARNPLPGCSPRLVAAVADARSHVPGLQRSVQGQALRFVASKHGDGNAKANH